MKKKYIIKNLRTNQYLKYKCNWTPNVMVAYLYDTIGDAEDEVIKVMNTNKFIEIVTVYVKEG